MLQDQLRDQIESMDVKSDVLGIAVCYEDYQDSHNKVLKIMHVHRGSPAERLIPEGPDTIVEPLQPGQEFIIAA